MYLLQIYVSLLVLNIVGFAVGYYLGLRESRSKAASVAYALFGLLVTALISVTLLSIIARNTSWLIP